MPEAAHGTNPATATMCGCVVREVPVDAEGDVDLEALRAAVGPKTAGIMLTNPSTLGVFERRIEEVARIVHAAGGLLYYDGANLNAILGKVRPGDMGFDVIHMNLHKTFSTPHGGGGPGAGRGRGQRAAAAVPADADRRAARRALPLADGARSAAVDRPALGVHGQRRGAAARLYLHAHARPGGHGEGGRIRHAQRQLSARRDCSRRASMRPIRSAAPATSSSSPSSARRQELGVTAMDFAKRLLDHGFHAPTTYFPLLVPECLLIEPTETESKAALDAFVAAMGEILAEAAQEPERVTGAPHTMPVRRLDDVRAAKQLDLTWKPTGAHAIPPAP